MENAQEFNIPLSSPLEINSEHTIIDARNPTFAINPQSPISGLLHNAIKYEADGVFCGKYRYEYAVRYTYRFEDSKVSEYEDASIISHNIPWDEPADSALIEQNRDDISRNFYRYEGIPYAMDVSFPRTNKLRNLSFTTGFDTRFIKTIGAENKIVRHDDVTAVDENKSKYEISGKTNLLGKSFKIFSNAYTHEVDAYDTLMDEPEDLDIAPRTYIPEHYDSQLQYNKDTILYSLLHKTYTQDNVALQLPLFIDHNLANHDLVFERFRYRDGCSTFGFVDTPGTINIYDDGRPPELPGFNLQLNSAGDQGARHGENTLDEYDEIIVQNTNPGVNAQIDLETGTDIIGVAATQISKNLSNTVEVQKVLDRLTVKPNANTEAFIYRAENNYLYALTSANRVRARRGDINIATEAAIEAFAQSGLNPNGATGKLLDKLLNTRAQVNSYCDTVLAVFEGVKNYSEDLFKLRNAGRVCISQQATLSMVMDAVETIKEIAAKWKVTRPYPGNNYIAIDPNATGIINMGEQFWIAYLNIFNGENDFSSGSRPNTIERVVYGTGALYEDFYGTNYVGTYYDALYQLAQREPGSSGVLAQYLIIRDKCLNSTDGLEMWMKSTLNACNINMYYTYGVGSWTVSPLAMKSPLVPLILEGLALATDMETATAKVIDSSTNGTASLFKFWQSQDLSNALRSMGADSMEFNVTTMRTFKTNLDDVMYPVGILQKEGRMGLPIIDIKCQLRATVSRLVTSSYSKGGKGGGGSSSGTTTSYETKEILNLKLRYVLFCNSARDGDWFAKEVDSADDYDEHSIIDDYMVENGIIDPEDLENYQVPADQEVPPTVIVRAGEEEPATLAFSTNLDQFITSGAIQWSDGAAAPVLDTATNILYSGRTTGETPTLVPIKFKILDATAPVFPITLNKPEGSPNLVSMEVTTISGSITRGSTSIPLTAFISTLDNDKISINSTSELQVDDVVTISYQATILRAVLPTLPDNEIGVTPEPIIKVKMMESKTTGILIINKLNLGSTEQDGRDIGIAFEFTPVTRTYVKAAKFRETGTDSITIYQGNEPIQGNLKVIPYVPLGLNVEQSLTIPQITNQFVHYNFLGRDENETITFEQMIDLPYNLGVSSEARNPLRLYSINNVPLEPRGFTKFGDVFTIPTPGELRDGQYFAGIVKHGTDKSQGEYILTNIRDTTIRRIKLRRAHLFSRSGDLSGVTLTNILNRQTRIDADMAYVDDMLIRLSQNNGRDPLELAYSNNLFAYEVNSSDRNIELSNSSLYQRYLQYADGTWATPELTSLETSLTGVLDGLDMQVQPTRMVTTARELWYQTLSLIHQRRSKEVVTRQFSEAWKQISAAANGLADFVNIAMLTAYFVNLTILIHTTYSSNSILNESDLGGMYRLVFRNADKAMIEFFPQGIYQKENNSIKMRSYQALLDRVTVNFDYVNQEGEAIEDASVTTYYDSPVQVDNDSYEKGRGFVAIDAYDIEKGTRKDLQLADPDVDFGIVPQQFDTDLDTTHMYYLDETHIMKCTSEKFMLLEANDDNEWSVIDEITNIKFVGSVEFLKFGVSSAMEGLPCFYYIQPVDNGIRIHYCLIEAEHFGKDFFTTLKDLMRSTTISFSQVASSGFSIASFAFLYEPPKSDTFINMIKVSATCVNRALIIGIVHDAGIHQWTVTIENPLIDNNHTVFNGYGYVGIDGTLTGSAIPMFAMNDMRGLSVSIKERPNYFANNMAFISGNQLVFSDDMFANGICTGAKYLNSGRYELKALPLRFSRSLLKNLDSDKGQDLNTAPKYFPPINIGVVHFATVWSYTKAVAGLAINSWTVDKLPEEDAFTRVEVDGKTEAVPVNDWLIRIGYALLTGLTAGASQLAENVVETKFGVDKSEAERKERITARIESVKKRLENIHESNTEQIAAAESEIESLQASLNRDNDPVSVGISTTIDGLFTGNLSGTESMAVAKAGLGSSALYSVSPKQNVYAGPGFTQIHFTEGSRISGSYSWGQAAKGGGTMFVPRMPPIPIPFIGTFDLNNTGVLGFNPVDGPNVHDFKMHYQPNVNVGSKHLVYSYPTAEVETHIIRQTMLAPTIGQEITDLYESDFKKRIYYKDLLRFKHWTEVAEITDNCSIVQGVDKLYGQDDVSPVPIKIDSQAPIYAAAGTFDFCVYAPSELYYTAVAGEVTGVSIRDTLVMDGLPDNVVIKNNLPLIASPYACIQTVKNLRKALVRPQVYSGDTLFTRTTGLNAIKGTAVYHGFDGYTNRISKLVGEVGTDSEVLNHIHTYVKQGVFKTGSIVPPVSYFGKFTKIPEIAGYLHPINVHAQYLNNMGTAEENLLGYRYALPIIHKSLAYLPAAKQVYAPYKPFVIDGITSLTTGVRTTTARNKSPSARDFVINGQAFRAADEYISKLDAASGVVELNDLVATLGLKYLGSTPQVAWFYAPTMNGFYTFSMSNPTIGAVSMDFNASAYRFKDVEEGTWDFVSQEVVFKAMIERDLDIDRHIYKNLVRVKDQFVGMVYPPNHNIVDKYGNFEILSTANGLALQGEERGQVNRWVLHDYMFREYPEMAGLPGWNRVEWKPNDGLQVNHGNWIRVKGDSVDDFWGERSYDIDNNYRQIDRIYGYFMEPFKLATSFLGLDESTDCLFEWEINFALTPLMRKLISNKYIKINLAAETIIPGGAAVSEVTHLYLTAEHFSRKRTAGALPTSDAEIGYYTFRFQGRNGAGNSERLYIWSDGCVALRGLKLMAQPTTSSRTMPSVTQVDVATLEEL